MDRLLMAFGLYLLGGAAILGIGRLLAGASQPTKAKLSVYASGEAPPSMAALPGYRGFFVIALFFAVLHLGALIVAAYPPSIASTLFVTVLLLTLLAMLFGEKRHDHSTH